MKHQPLMYALLASVVALLLLAWAPGGTSSAHARPLAALTPTAEPPTRTPAGPTVVPPPQPRPTVPPTDTPGPIDTPQPTREPGTERADPAVTKSVSPSEARIGDIVDFTITVTNHGGETADDVVVTDELPDFLDLIEANASKGAIASSGRTVVTTVGSVAPGEVVIIRIRTRVNERALPPGGRNSVSLVSSNNSDDPDNNTAGIGIVIAGPAASPTVAPTEGAGTAAGEPPADAAGASAASKPAQAARPNLPATSAGADRPGAAWPLALLGLTAIALSLSLRRRGSSKP